MNPLIDPAMPSISQNAVTVQKTLNDPSNNSGLIPKTVYCQGSNDMSGTHVPNILDMRMEIKMLQRRIDEQEKHLLQKSKQIAILQQQNADLRRKYGETNQSVIQQNVALQRGITEIRSENFSQLRELERLRLENATLKGKNEELNSIVLKLYQMRTGFLNEEPKVPVPTTHSPESIETSFKGNTTASPIFRNTPRKVVKFNDTPTIATVQQLPIEEDIENIKDKTKAITINVENSTTEILDSLEKKGDNMEDINSTVSDVSREEQLSKMNSSEKIVIKRNAKAYRRTRPYNKASNTSDQEQLDEFQNEEKSHVPEKSNIDQSDLDEKKKERESSITYDSEDEKEKDIVLEQMLLPTRRSTRHKDNVSYLEPSLRSKLRRGYDHTFGVDPNDLNIVYKFTEKKSNTR